MKTRRAVAVLGLIILLPGALLGGNLAGVECYARDHALLVRTHHGFADYRAALDASEWSGAAVGALPGAALWWRGRRPLRRKGGADRRRGT